VYFREEMKKTTIYTLAKELNLSPSTISKALNNSPNINAETAALVRRKAAEQDFTLRPFVSRSTNICAVLQTTGIQDNCFTPYTIAVMQGMMEYLQEHELEFSILNDSAEQLNNGTLQRQLGKRNVNGAVLININKDCFFWRELDRHEFPYCSLLTDHCNPQRQLSIDNSQAAEQAIDYLLQLGHRNIAVLSTPIGTKRVNGYRKALERAGLQPNPDYIIQADYEIDGLVFGHSCVTDLFRRKPEITALLVMGSRAAIGAMHAFYHLGISIPQQVSLIAFDDAPEAAYLNPPLTVMRVPNKKLGYSAARWVHRMITGTAGNDIRIQESWMRGELVVRGSTGQPRNQPGQLK